MTSSALTRAVALRKVTAHGIDAVLSQAGFERKGRLTWVRQISELQHVISLLNRRSTYDVQWGVISPEVVPILWGTMMREGDVGFSVMSGTPSSIRHPAACEYFQLQDPISIEAVEKIISGLAEDMQVVADRLREFETRRHLRSYLLMSRDLKDRRDFIIPMNLPLKLFTAAALAVVDSDPECCELIGAAKQAMVTYKDKNSLARLRRLEEASGELCL